MRMSMWMLGVLLLSHEAWAQEAPTDPPTAAAQAEPRTLFDASTPREVAAALVLRGTTAGNNPGLMLGARAGIVADNILRLGVAGFITAFGPIANTGQDSALTTLAPYRNERRFFFGYGGIEAAYRLVAARSASVEVTGLVGAGGVGHKPTDGNGPYIGTDAFMVLEPGASVGVALADGWTLRAGVGYRWAYGVELDGVVANADQRIDALDGFNGDLAIDVSF